MSKNKLYVANVGDSRAVMGMYPPEEATETKESNKSNNDDEEDEDYLNIDSMDLSRDHKPDEPLERERIIRSGGFIKPARFGQSARVYLDPEMTMVGIATSRTIGNNVAVELHELVTIVYEMCVYLYSCIELLTRCYRLMNCVTELQAILL